MTGGDGLYLGVDVGTTATRVSLLRPDGTVVAAARRFGLLFPVGSVGGAGYLRALREPLPGLRAVVSGGIAAGEVGGYLAAGAHAVCLGGALIDGRRPGGVMRPGWQPGPGPRSIASARKPGKAIQLCPVPSQRPSQGSSSWHCA